MPVYNKLVRDNIPEIIRDEGKIPVVRELTDEEFKVELKKKLIEEATEVANAESVEDIIKELADVETIIHYIKREYSIDDSQVGMEQYSKFLKNGLFDEKLFLEEVK